ncbi:uncharacterized protein LOC115161168 isoform X2 [Salmo trutta]|uniref:uncharacterized protein LOC115161168 isoform X2 n=1 Tax=Salmo trutta TaxID=8032 RepID=UPI0011319802|nr:uncharacterized protein LOC115161168 isoform X2 [Salmo trutta]
MRPLGSGTITHVTAPLTLTMGTIPFLINTSPVHNAILSLPWFQRPNPTTSWLRMTITACGPGCRRTCFSVPCGSTPVESPVAEALFQKVFRYYGLPEEGYRASVQWAGGVDRPGTGEVPKESLPGLTGSSSSESDSQCSSCCWGG